MGSFRRNWRVISDFLGVAIAAFQGGEEWQRSHDENHEIKSFFSKFFCLFRMKISYEKLRLSSYWQDAAVAIICHIYSIRNEK